MLQQLSFLHSAAKHVHILELQCMTQEMWVAGCRLPKPWLPGLSGFILFFSSLGSWIKNGPMAGQVLTNMRCKILPSHILLTLHKSWQLPIPLVYRWLFFKINSQVFIQGEINSIHNIFSHDYLWGPCLDSRSVFFPCRCLVLYCSIYIFCASLCFTGVEVQLRMAGDSRVLMDHNMEIGVTPAQVSCAACADHGNGRT